MLPRRKFMTGLHKILKCRNVILITKIGIIKAVGFPVVALGCESWILRKAEGRKINAVELCGTAENGGKRPWTAARTKH